MKFIEKKKIKSTFDIDFVSEIKKQKAEDRMYCVTKKAEGHQISSYYNGDEFKFADKDGFSKMNSIPKTTLSEIIAFHKWLWGFFRGSVEELVLHSTIKDSSVNVFDMSVDGKYISMHGFTKAIRRLNSTKEHKNISYTKIFLIGIIDDCIKYTKQEPGTDFIVKLYETDIALNNGERVILQSKQNKKETVKNLTPMQDLTAYKIFLSITEDNLKAVVSGIKKIKTKKVTAISKAFAKKVITEWKENNDMGEDFNIVSKAVSEKCKDLVKKNYDDIIEGIFI